MSESTPQPTPTTLRQRTRESVRLIAQSVRLAWRVSPGLVAGLVALVLAQAGLPALQLALVRLVVDRAAADAGIAPLAAGALAAQQPLVTWIVLAAAVVAAGQLLQSVADTCQSLVGDRMDAHVMEELIRAANRWPGVARFEDPAFADDLLRAREQVGTGGVELVMDTVQALVALVTAVGLVLLLAGLHPVLPLVVAGASLPRLAREWDYMRRTAAALTERAPEMRRLDYLRDTVLRPEPAKDVRLYGLVPFFVARYEGVLAEMLGRLQRLRWRLTVGMSLSDALGTAGALAAYVLAAWTVARGQGTVGDIALYGGAATLLQFQCIVLGALVGELPRTLAFVPSLFRILEAPPDLPIARDALPAPRPLREGIAFERVSFAYPMGPTGAGGGETAAGTVGEPVLRDLSFRIRPGECVALAGHNGAGKTTIVKLLLRLFDPTDGRVLLDGEDLRAYDPEEVRREIAVVFQDFVRYELTAGENVGLGRVEALDDRERLRAAAERAAAGGLLDALPQGLETPLGRELGGRELSGGEWQKLALARAMMRATGPGDRDGMGGAQLLVLDEPTAALDVQTEYEIYTRFRELTRGRATLLISHRFSTIRMADRILFLANGGIQEEGSHEELMALGGEYARLYRLQASQYLAEADETQTAQPEVVR